LSSRLEKDISHLDSFVIYICLTGSCEIIQSNQEKTSIIAGETVLVPASLILYSIVPENKAKLLEVFITTKADEKD
jgi:mannose-6-phosphate isomerase